MSREQRAVYEYVCNCLQSNFSSVIFIDVPGRTGNTFVINLILAKVRSYRVFATAVASSGIAAALMPGGRATFKI